jgi:hypothetical protein
MNFLLSMGRTLPSFRPALQHEISTWKPFRRGLAPEDQKHFDTIMTYAQMHSDAGSLCPRCMLSEHIFLGCALEQQKRIAELEHRIIQIEDSFQGKK